PHQFHRFQSSIRQNSLGSLSRHNIDFAGFGSWQEWVAAVSMGTEIVFFKSLVHTDELFLSAASIAPDSGSKLSVIRLDSPIVTKLECSIASLALASNRAQSRSREDMLSHYFSS